MRAECETARFPARFFLLSHINAACPVNISITGLNERARGKTKLMTRTTTQIFDAAATARLIPYPALVDALKGASIDYAQQRIVSPERLVVPLNAGGIMLSMPATAPDLGIHKMVNVCA